ncbi:hypothetical protein D9M68_991950 [compost metagenome]
MAGMNQVKSNRAISPASEAREVNRINSPVQRACSSAREIDSGRPALGDWIRALSASTLARMKNSTRP